MNSSVAVFSILAVMLSASANAQNKDFNSKNDWLTPNVSVTLGQAYGYHSVGSKSFSPMVRFNAENMTASPVFQGQARADIAVGYAPSGYLRLRYIVMPSDNNDTNSKFFWIVPLVGDLNLRPGMNQLQHPLKENLTASTAWIGGGYLNSGKLNASGTSTWRASGAVKYVVFNEMISPGLYSYAGAQQNGRESINAIDAKGWTTELRGQFSLMNKVLLGVGGEGSKLRQKNFNGGSDVEYYNYEGTVYARVRVLGKNKLTLDIDANCYLRLTNLNDMRVNETRSYPGVGARIGF